MRKEAGGCLVNLLRDAKVQKRRECRAILQQRSSELLFCPDRETRTILAHFLSKNRNLDDALPANLHIEHLPSMYRTQILEINGTTISQTSSCFINHGMFQRRKVTVVWSNRKKKIKSRMNKMSRLLGKNSLELFVMSDWRYTEKYNCIRRFLSESVN